MFEVPQSLSLRAGVCSADSSVEVLECGKSGENFQLPLFHDLIVHVQIPFLGCFYWPRLNFVCLLM
jgi:hypothetical protein